MRILFVVVILLSVFTSYASDASHPNPATVLRRADSVSRAPDVPGAVRAHNLRLLGDYRFVRKDYAKAAEFYYQAMAHDSVSGTYRELYTRAMALATDAPVSASIAPAVSMPAAPAKPALSASDVSVSVIPAPATPTPAASASTPAVPALSIPAVSAPLLSAPSTPAMPQSPVFTVQVGAFGSEANANNLVAKLSETYKDITVSSAASGESTLFRVRIGTFNNREDAAAFANRLITESGLSARVAIVGD